MRLRILEFQAVAGRIHQEAVVEWDARQVGNFLSKQWIHYWKGAKTEILGTNSINRGKNKRR